MKALNKTRKQLLEEIAALQARVSELEARKGPSSEQGRQELGERMSRYFVQSEHLQEAVYVLFDRKFEFISQKFAELFAVTPEEVCGSQFNPLNLVAPESRQFIMEMQRKGFRGEFAHQEFEFTGLKKDGSKIECATMTLFIPYKWGVAIHGVLRDITVRKRIDEELQRERRDLQIVLNSIPTSVFYADRDRRFLRANKAFCKSIGFPLEQIIGKTLADLFPHLPAEQIDHFYEINDQVMASGCSRRGLIETLPSVRGRRWIQNDRVPYRDERGNILGIICMAMDISDFRETEEKLWYLSCHDVLSGLYNRAYFEEEMYRLEKGRQFPISIISLKVNDLEAVNDAQGIDGGNELLKQAAKLLKAFRTEDIVARIGGDRFAALLPLTDRSLAEMILKRLKDALEAHNRHCKGTPLRLAFGIATGEKGCSLSETLKHSEAVMN